GVTSGSIRPMRSPRRTGSLLSRRNIVPPLRALVELGYRAGDVAAQIAGERLVRDLDRVADRPGIRSAVRLDERMREAEQRRSTVLLPVGDRLQLIDRRRQRDEAEPPRQAFLVRVA